MTDQFFDKVYTARSPDETRDLYDAWSGSYDTDVTGNGYATPKRCAEALARQIGDLTTPVLDFGCGTGLSGKALAAAGFQTIDGVDLSADMLAVAQDKGIYRHLRQISAGASPVDTPGAYFAIAAIGVIGAGAAPISVFDTLMDALPKDGMLVLSFNDHALAEPANEGRLSEWMDCGAAHLLFKEYGPHLPGIGLKSNVYVLAKA